MDFQAVWGNNCDQPLTGSKGWLDFPGAIFLLLLCMSIEEMIRW